MTLGLRDEVSVGPWVVSCWNCCVDSDVVRVMVLGVWCLSIVSRSDVSRAIVLGDVVLRAAVRGESM